jgi:hypothetical protein
MRIAKEETIEMQRQYNSRENRPFCAGSINPMAKRKGCGHQRSAEISPENQ